jgi:hypothetical protein
MSHGIAWCGFFGAWLLVAGPVYQAAIEIEDEEFQRSDLERAASLTDAPPPVSRWWLLLPPLAYLLALRRQRAHRRAVMAVLTPTQIEQFMHLRSTAAAWLFVASGASLIAVKETWELHEAYEWSTWIFYALIGLMITACAANTALRIRRRDDILRRVHPG